MTELINQFKSNGMIFQSNKVFLKVKLFIECSSQHKASKMPESNVGNQFDDFNVVCTQFLPCQNDCIYWVEEPIGFIKQERKEKLMNRL